MPQISLNRPYMRVFSCAALLCGLAFFAGCEQRTTSKTSAPSAQPSAAAVVAPGTPLERVTDASQVCMFNDEYMGAPQAPVVVNARTYYGCCPGCNERLEKDAAARQATDPVSQRPVDKALAVIGRTRQGALVYFENEQNLRAFSDKPQK